MRDDWEEIELSQVLNIKNRKLGQHVDEPPIFAMSKHQGVVLSSDFFGKRIASKNLEGYKTLEPGDWVYSTIHIDEGSIATNRHPHWGVVSPMYTTMSWNSEDHSAEYFELLLRSPKAINTYGENAQGTVNRRRSLSFARFSQLKFSVPPLREQKRIVDLISTVDSYMEALRQELETAKKSRAEVLHELLTLGGDGWFETTLDQVASINPSEPPLSPSAPFAPMDAVHAGKRWLQYTQERRERNGARAQAGDVLFARITPCLENGKVAQVQSSYPKCGGSTEFIVLRGSETCSSDYLFFWCSSNRTRQTAASLMTGTTGRQRLSATDLGKIPLLLPPLPEQTRIVDLMSTVDSYIESIEEQLAASISLRASLLSDLLSGKHEIPASYDQLIDVA